MTKKILGLNHLALRVVKLEECVAFYTKIIGMKSDWEPDADNVYLTSGNDNLALHRAPENFSGDSDQRLDHLGFQVESHQAVDEWYQYCKEQGVTLRSEPKTHRDGARSFYCEDPDGNIVQMICYGG